MRPTVTVEGVPCAIRCQHNKPNKRNTNLRITVAKVYLATGNAIDGTILAEASAVCDPKDQFSKRIGRQLAAARLCKRLKDLGWPKDARRAAWNAINPPKPVKEQKDPFEEAINAITAEAVEARALEEKFDGFGYV